MWKRPRSAATGADDDAPAGVDEEIEAEFAHHLEALRDQILGEGFSREDAAEELRRRFGEPDRYKRVCLRIARKEQTMLQRLNLGLTALLIAGLLVLGFQILSIRSEQRAAMIELTQRLDQLAASAPAAAPTRPTRGVVYLDGEIARPGVYELPADARLTVSRVIVAAGGQQAPDEHLVRVHRLVDGTEQVIYEVELADLQDRLVEDLALQPDDHIQVSRRTGFESESSRLHQELEDERARTAALAGFLMQTLAAQDLGAPRSAGIHELLDQAASRIDRTTGMDPVVEAALRESVRTARDNHNGGRDSS